MTDDNENNEQRYIQVPKEQWDKLSGMIAAGLKSGKAKKDALTAMSEIIAQGTECDQNDFNDLPDDPLEKYRLGAYDPDFADAAAAAALDCYPNDEELKTNILLVASHCFTKCLIIYYQIITQLIAQQDNQIASEISLATVELFVSKIAKDVPENPVSHIYNEYFKMSCFKVCEPMQECCKALQPFLGTAMEDKIIIRLLASLSSHRFELLYENT